MQAYYGKENFNRISAMVVLKGNEFKPTYVHYDNLTMPTIFMLIISFNNYPKSIFILI